MPVKLLLRLPVLLQKSGKLSPTHKVMSCQITGKVIHHKCLNICDSIIVSSTNSEKTGMKSVTKMLSGLQSLLTSLQTR
jgi:hypothetical protein